MPSNALADGERTNIDEVNDDRRSIPKVAYVTLCKGIEPEPNDGSILVTGLQQRFAMLTIDLPLAGGDALTPTTGGTLSLTRLLHQEAPWLGAAIDRIDAQLRLQLWAGRPWVAFRPLLLVAPPGCG